jgi:DNA repair photolyase
MRWSGQEITVEQTDALPGLAKLNNLVRSVRTPEFAGVTFHEVLAKSALNKVPGGGGALPFGWTINPYRGCSHACSYCLTPDTRILMADGRQRPLRDIEVGDVVMGTRQDDAYRRYAPSTVLAKWGTRKRAYRVTLADGTEIVSSGDHRFLTDRGWKHVTGAMSGPNQRPYLTTNNALMGFGAGPRKAPLPTDPSPAYRRGYLTGMTRGDGMMIARDYRRKNGAINRARYFRLAPADGEALDRSREYLVGGLPVRSRFFDTVRPAIARKLSMEGVAVKSTASLRVISIEYLGTELEMIDITTETGDFIANGVISHNCFARPTHRYLDLNMGTDFDREIIVKVNVAEVLRKELAKPNWGRHPVALGTNTDPYQRAEGRYRLMPDIIEALAASGTPFSILTKGTLLRRDLDLLTDAATRVPVDLAMSIAVYDDELQKSVEPGTPSTKARLETVRAVRERGLECAVFMMPILPYLTDSRAQLDAALAAAKVAGASSVLYTALHLRPGVKEWFMLWLEREHPELVPKYRAMYGSKAYAPLEYRRWLAARIKPLIAAHGLQRGEEDPVTGGVRSAALNTLRDADGNRMPATHGVSFDDSARLHGGGSAGSAHDPPAPVVAEERLTLF